MDMLEQVASDKRRADNELAYVMSHADKWPVTSSDLKDYNHDFKPLLYALTGHRSIQNVVHTWEVPTAELVGINLMGDTRPLNDLGIGGFGCELMDNKRDDDLRKLDTKARRTVIEGDLDSEETWQKIQKQLGDKKINLGLWRSVSGISTLPALPHSIFRQINKAFPLMADKNSLYIAEFTRSASTIETATTPLLVTFINDLVQGMNIIPGIHAQYTYGIEKHMEGFTDHNLFFGYTKEEKTPDELPLALLKQQSPLLQQWIEMSEKYVPRSSQQ